MILAGTCTHAGASFSLGGIVKPANAAPAGGTTPSAREKGAGQPAVDQPVLSWRDRRIWLGTGSEASRFWAGAGAYGWRGRHRRSDQAQRGAALRPGTLCRGLRHDGDEIP